MEKNTICEDKNIESNPKKNKWKPKPATKFFIIILFILCVIMSFILSDNSTTNDSKTNKYVALNIQDLYDDYYSNEISAKEKYSDNKYYFTGTIYDIKHFLTDNYITIRYENKKDEQNIIEITAYFDNKEELLNIEKGDEVTIYGKFYQRSFENYMGELTCFSFKHCTFGKEH